VKNKFTSRVPWREKNGKTSGVRNWFRFTPRMARFGKGMMLYPHAKAG